ncbi:type III secretion system cytoplasmic ring protein SctQ [Massilia sp. MB5]|uniref:type III secretion system cytoplasmic ring protein SctQ n=1 Tax=Massilia sp. MB5 TaxID=2919578 RepID=UPI001F10F0D3|nr:type III secretion system cytoplasmic ring protein SctQ [Massilia sp. MB5]UMR32256.1 type III secretion system cytoplasmic ring protein SctQ [Massilia sp. MB5]
MAESEVLPAAPTRPARLQRSAVSAAYAELSRRAAGGLCCRHDAMTLRLEWAGASDAAPPGAALCLDGPAGQLWLDDGAALLHGLSGIDPLATASAPAAQREWLDAALLGRLARTPLAPLRSLQREAAVPPQLLPLHLSLGDGTHMAATIARASPQTWLALLNHGAWNAPGAPLPALAQLPIVLPVRAATHSLPLAALQTLAPGDVILPNAPCFDIHGAGSLSLGGRLMQVRYGAPGLLAILSMEMQLNQDSEDGGEQARQPVAAQQEAVTEETPAQTATMADDASLDQLPLALSFELGMLSLNLGQLRTLAAGAVLQLEQGSAESIAIRCSGRELGRGEAVDVDGRLGIRITSWSAAC